MKSENTWFLLSANEVRAKIKANNSRTVLNLAGLEARGKLEVPA